MQAMCRRSGCTVQVVLFRVQILNTWCYDRYLVYRNEAMRKYAIPFVDVENMYSLAR